jgi:hypothetical protein
MTAFDNPEDLEFSARVLAEALLDAGDWRGRIVAALFRGHAMPEIRTLDMHCRTHLNPQTRALQIEVEGFLAFRMRATRDVDERTIVDSGPQVGNLIREQAEDLFREAGICETPTTTSPARTATAFRNAVNNSARASGGKEATIAEASARSYSDTVAALEAAAAGVPANLRTQRSP